MNFYVLQGTRPGAERKPEACPSTARVQGQFQQLPAGGAVLVWLDDDHLHADGRPQEVDHLLVGEGCHGDLADLHQPAALPKPRLPGEAEGLHEIGRASCRERVSSPV